MKQPTVPAFKRWARKNRDLAMTVLKARVFAEMENERVEAYREPVFAKYEFTNDMDRPRNTHKGEKLTHSKQLYLSENEELCKAFYAECELAHREHGFDGPEGHCPALSAESLQREAEQLLLDSLGEFCGIDGNDFNRSLEMRTKALELALASCLGKLV